MFREMRRKKQLLPQKKAEEILLGGTSGVLALSGDNGYPYAVPISYVYDGRHIYFHSARNGHKLDSVLRNPKASFCVIAEDSVRPETYTTLFQSVIVFGKLRVLEDGREKRSAIEKLALRYAPGDSAGGRNRAINQEWDRFCMLDMSIDQMTGKASIERIRDKNGQASPGSLK